MNKNKFYPVTPAGTVCYWLPSETEDEAWEKLMEDAAHMPYRNKQAFVERGYTVIKSEKAEWK